MIDCLYRRLGADGEFQAFESTDGTRSNWDPEIQHGSPPLALMTKLIEELAADSGLRVGRLTLDSANGLAAGRVHRHLYALDRSRHLAGQPTARPPAARS